MSRSSTGHGRSILILQAVQVAAMRHAHSRLENSKKLRENSGQSSFGRVAQISSPPPPIASTPLNINGVPCWQGRCDDADRILADFLDPGPRRSARCAGARGLPIRRWLVLPAVAGRDGCRWTKLRTVISWKSCSDLQPPAPNRQHPAEYQGGAVLAGALR